MLFYEWIDEVVADASWCRSGRGDDDTKRRSIERLRRISANIEPAVFRVQRVGR